MMSNQNPEQIARDNIDKQLIACGWIIQSAKKLNLFAGVGVAVKEYLTDVGPADYVLFVEGKPCGIIEAKKEDEGFRLSVHEVQGENYANAKLKYLNNEPLPFLYLSTGEITRFSNLNDPKPRFREIFTFHQPETLAKWQKNQKSLRKRLLDIPELPIHNLRDCQVNAINNLEKSFKDFKLKSLIQMATGSGKTFTAITFIYRLLKYAKADKILFLVDTKNLGEQAEAEFRSYIPQDDNRLFPELYGVTRLSSAHIPKDSQVYISTIQRMYSILRGTDLDESAEESNPNEFAQNDKPVHIQYNPKLPIEFFDFIIIDECHRSIYNLWKQVLDYFDVFQIGLTATPDNRTFGYFNQNVVSDYKYEDAVIDGVLVPYNVFEIQTKISKYGGAIKLGEWVDKRERLTRKKFWETVDEDIEYAGRQLDKDIVNPSQIRLIIKSVKETLPQLFKERIDEDGVFEVPKTLIFAKTDSHADDIIDIVREEFGEENKFCKKITYRSEDDPKSVLSNFRNEYYPRIAVTVDMIATGTDIKPLEVLVFMRDVKSRSYYEQMKGRGTRTISIEQLRKVSKTAKFPKDHFVIIDAIGVECSQKTDSRPLEKSPGVSLKEILNRIAIGNREEETLTTLANRLIRLDKQINEKEKLEFAKNANGKTIQQVVKDLLNAYNPDTIEHINTTVGSKNIGEAPIFIQNEIKQQHQALIENAVSVFHNPDLRDFVVDVRKKYDQIIDNLNIDSIEKIGWVKDNAEQSEKLISDFKTWMLAHKDELTALQIFYNQPYRRRELTYTMIKEVLEKLQNDKPTLAPLNVWKAYEALGQCNGSPRNELTAIVSLIRKVTDLDTTLTSYDKIVDKNFQEWIFKKNAGQHNKFNEEQMQWLRMIKDYVVNSFHIDKDDFDLNPFNAQGGLGKMWQLFGEKTDEIINELNEELAA
jgi:type I restriction enzyme R subunit